MSSKFELLPCDKCAGETYATKEGWWCKNPTCERSKEYVTPSQSDAVDLRKENATLHTLNDQLRQRDVAITMSATGLIAKLESAMPNEGGWENTCPLCGFEVPQGELKHKPSCPMLDAITLKAILEYEPQKTLPQDDQVEVGTDSPTIAQAEASADRFMKHCGTTPTPHNPDQLSPSQVETDKGEELCQSCDKPRSSHYRFNGFIYCHENPETSTTYTPKARGLE